MNRAILATLVFLVIVIMAIPTILVSIQAASSTERDQTEEKRATTLQIEEDAAHIPVYLTKEKRIVKPSLEAYIRGVVAAEMPADFNKEALKAQALAARTYIIDRVARQDFSDMEQFGETAKGAWVSDTVQHQVYYTDEQLERHWGRGLNKSDYIKKSNRINEAVNETKGQVITYEGRPIYAAFFSTSNGKTENSEDYWQDRYPYLRSVDSSWDKEAPSYEGEPVTLHLSEFSEKLEQSTGKPIAVTASAANKDDWITIVSKTEGDNIAEIKIGDQTYTGREVREALDLRSSDFSWTVDGDHISFTTRGYGHGVGMSQWGANLMAEEGKTAQEIIEHYYQGVSVEDYYQWVKETGKIQKKTG